MDFGICRGTRTNPPQIPTDNQPYFRYIELNEYIIKINFMFPFFIFLNLASRNVEIYTAHISGLYHIFTGEHKTKTMKETKGTKTTEHKRENLHSLGTR